MRTLFLVIVALLAAEAANARFICLDSETDTEFGCFEKGKTYSIGNHIDESECEYEKKRAFEAEVYLCGNVKLEKHFVEIKKSKAETLIKLRKKAKGQYSIDYYNGISKREVLAVSEIEKRHYLKMNTIRISKSACKALGLAQTETECFDPAERMCPEGTFLGHDSICHSSCPQDYSSTLRICYTKSDSPLSFSPYTGERLTTDPSKGLFLQEQTQSFKISSRSCQMAGGRPQGDHCIMSRKRQLFGDTYDIYVSTSTANNVDWFDIAGATTVGTNSLPEISFVSKFADSKFAVGDNLGKLYLFNELSATADNTYTVEAGKKIKGIQAPRENKFLVLAWTDKKLIIVNYYSGSPVEKIHSISKTMDKVIYLNETHVAMANDFGSYWLYNTVTETEHTDRNMGLACPLDTLIKGNSTSFVLHCENESEIYIWNEFFERQEVIDVNGEVIKYIRQNPPEMNEIELIYESKVINYRFDGKSTEIDVAPKKLLSSIDLKFVSGRVHSLVIGVTDVFLNDGTTLTPYPATDITEAGFNFAQLIERNRFVLASDDKIFFYTFTDGTGVALDTTLTAANSADKFTSGAYFPRFVESTTRYTAFTCANTAVDVLFSRFPDFVGSTCTFTCDTADSYYEYLNPLNQRVRTCITQIDCLYLEGRVIDTIDGKNSCIHKTNCVSPNLVEDNKYCKASLTANTDTLPIHTTQDHCIHTLIDGEIGLWDSATSTCDSLYTCVTSKSKKINRYIDNSQRKSECVSACGTSLINTHNNECVEDCTTLPGYTAINATSCSATPPCSFFGASVKICFSKLQSCSAYKGNSTELVASGGVCDTAASCSDVISFGECNPAIFCTNKNGVVSGTTCTCVYSPEEDKCYADAAACKAAGFVIHESNCISKAKCRSYGKFINASDECINYDACKTASQFICNNCAGGPVCQAGCTGAFYTMADLFICTAYLECYYFEDRAAYSGVDGKKCLTTTECNTNYVLIKNICYDPCTDPTPVHQLSNCLTHTQCSDQTLPNQFYTHVKATYQICESFCDGYIHSKTGPLFCYTETQCNDLTFLVRKFTSYPNRLCVETSADCFALTDFKHVLSENNKECIKAVDCKANSHVVDFTETRCVSAACTEYIKIDLIETVNVDYCISEAECKAEGWFIRKDTDQAKKRCYATKPECATIPDAPHIANEALDECIKVADCHSANHFYSIADDKCVSACAGYWQLEDISSVPIRKCYTKAECNAAGKLFKENTDTLQRLCVPDRATCEGITGGFIVMETNDECLEITECVGPRNKFHFVSTKTCITTCNDYRRNNKDCLLKANCIATMFFIETPIRRCLDEAECDAESRIGHVTLRECQTVCSHILDNNQISTVTSKAICDSTCPGDTNLIDTTLAPDECFPPTYVYNTPLPAFGATKYKKTIPTTADELHSYASCIATSFANYDDQTCVPSCTFEYYDNTETNLRYCKAACDPPMKKVPTENACRFDCPLSHNYLTTEDNICNFACPPSHVFVEEIPSLHGVGYSCLTACASRFVVEAKDFICQTATNCPAAFYEVKEVNNLGRPFTSCFENGCPLNYLEDTAGSKNCIIIECNDGELIVENAAIAQYSMNKCTDTCATFLFKKDNTCVLECNTFTLEYSNVCITSCNSTHVVEGNPPGCLNGGQCGTGYFKVPNYSYNGQTFTQCVQACDYTKYRGSELGACIECQTKVFKEVCLSENSCPKYTINRGTYCATCEEGTAYYNGNCLADQPNSTFYVFSTRTTNGHSVRVWEVCKDAGMRVDLNTKTCVAKCPYDYFEDKDNNSVCTYFYEIDYERYYIEEDQLVDKCSELYIETNQRRCILKASIPVCGGDEVLFNNVCLKCIDAGLYLYDEAPDFEKCRESCPSTTIQDEQNLLCLTCPKGQVIVGKFCSFCFFPRVYRDKTCSVCERDLIVQGNTCISRKECTGNFKIVERSCVPRNAGPCDVNPCGEKGECQVEGEKYKCKCLAGFVGKHCSVEEEKYDEVFNSRADEMIKMANKGISLLNKVILVEVSDAFELYLEVLPWTLVGKSDAFIAKYDEVYKVLKRLIDSSNSKLRQNVLNAELSESYLTLILSPLMEALYVRMEDSVNKKQGVVDPTAGNSTGSGANSDTTTTAGDTTTGDTTTTDATANTGSTDSTTTTTTDSTATNPNRMLTRTLRNQEFSQNIDDLKLLATQFVDAYIKANKIDKFYTLTFAAFHIYIYRSTKDQRVESSLTGYGIPLFELEKCEEFTELDYIVAFFEWRYPKINSESTGLIDFNLYDALTYKEISFLDCKRVTVKYPLFLEKVLEREEQVIYLNSQQVSLFSDGEPFFTDDCFNYSESGFSYTRQMRRDKYFPSKIAKCSEECDYKGMDNRLFAICECDSSIRTLEVYLDEPNISAAGVGFDWPGKMFFCYSKLSDFYKNFIFFYLTGLWLICWILVKIVKKLKDPKRLTERKTDKVRYDSYFTLYKKVKRNDIPIKEYANVTTAGVEAAPPVDAQIRVEDMEESETSRKESQVSSHSPQESEEAKEQLPDSERAKLEPRADFTYIDTKFDNSFLDTRSFWEGYWDIYRHNSFLSIFCVYSLFKPAKMYLMELFQLHLIIAFFSCVFYSNSFVEALEGSSCAACAIPVKSAVNSVAALAATQLFHGLTCFVLRPKNRDIDAATTIMTYLSMTESVYNSDKMNKRINTRMWGYSLSLLFYGLIAVFYSSVLLNVFKEEGLTVLLVVAYNTLLYHILTPICLLAFYSAMRKAKDNPKLGKWVVLFNKYVN